MSWISELARPEIRALTPYQHAAWEPQLTRLHANELPWRVQGDASLAGLNRYPEPQPPVLVQGLAPSRNAAAACVIRALARSAAELSDEMDHPASRAA